MPTDYRIIDQLTTPGTATERLAYRETKIRCIVATGSFNVAELRAYLPPRGADGALTLLINRAAAGTLQSAATPPTGKLYVWVDDDDSADNGTTIIHPISATAATAGNWMQITTVT